MKAPAFQFYPGDWMRDAALRSCSIAARGLWADMLCYMHEGSPYGHLRVGELAVTPEMLARMVGETSSKVTRWLTELEQAGVFSRTEVGVIYSRRMVRDERTRHARREAGAKGGNPALVNHKDKPPDKPQAQRRSKQKPTPASAVASASAPAVEPTAPNGAGWVHEAVADYLEPRPDAEISHAIVGQALKPLVKRHGWEVVRPPWKRFCAGPDARFGPHYFARNFPDYTGELPLNGHQPGKKPSLVEQSLASSAIAFGHEPND